MKGIEGGICAVSGITTAASHAGIKRKSNDVAIIYSESLANAAAVYTKNQIKSPCLEINKRKLACGNAQSIIIISGIANTLTGERGMKDISKITKIASQELNVEEAHMLSATTGKIGEFLPIEKIANAIKGISEQLGKSSSIAAKAIMTTDTREKELAFDCGRFKIGAIGKGSGMICPNMATMLCFIATDAILEPKQIQKALKAAADKSFNMLSVDGDMSTNDMAIILANGKSNYSPGNKEFQKALDTVCIEMAKKIASDGEGATKLIEANVINAKNHKDAKKAALAIVNSPLVKTAVYGQDANVGRIMCAVGYSEAKIHPQKIDVFIGCVQAVKNGVVMEVDAKSELDKTHVSLTVDLKSGSDNATAYGCDLTENYVKINARYRT